MKQVLVFLTIVAMLMISCEKEGENETKISQNYSSESHNTGENCMSCHKSGGPGEGWFTAAGSVYDSTLTQAYVNGSVVFSKVENNITSIIKSVELDTKGNFYTTEALSFGSGLKVSVQGRNGEQQTMNSPVTKGACNQCHGSTVERIWIK